MLSCRGIGWRAEADQRALTLWSLFMPSFSVNSAAILKERVDVAQAAEVAMDIWMPDACWILDSRGGQRAVYTGRYLHGRVDCSGG